VHHLSDSVCYSGVAPNIPQATLSSAGSRNVPFYSTLKDTNLDCEFPDVFGPIAAKLVNLDLSGNNIRGTIPESVGTRAGVTSPQSAEWCCLCAFPSDVARSPAPPQPSPRSHSMCLHFFAARSPNSQLVAGRMKKLRTLILSRNILTVRAASSAVPSHFNSLPPAMYGPSACKSLCTNSLNVRPAPPIIQRTVAYPWFAFL
jgi:Leucine Rich Repeat (LRR) protein